MNDADEYLRREAFHHAESFDRTVVATQMTTHELKPLIASSGAIRKSANSLA
jgi:hypothetical protein